MPLTEQFSLSGECVVNGDSVDLTGGMDSRCVPRGVLGPLQRASAMLAGATMRQGGFYALSAWAGSVPPLSIPPGWSPARLCPVLTRKVTPVSPQWVNSGHPHPWHLAPRW